MSNRRLADPSAGDGDLIGALDTDRLDGWFANLPAGLVAETATHLLDPALDPALDPVLDRCAERTSILLGQAT